MHEQREYALCNEIVGVRMRANTAIRLPFLFHTSTMSFKSLSVSFSGDSMTIFMDRLSSVKRLRRRFFIFMSEKLRSADTVEMGLDKHMVASLCRLGNNAIAQAWANYGPRAI